jgi:membrane fusion protein, heavy metal efflux system
MSIADHAASLRGRLSLWGGLVLGLLFLVAVFTHGFGLAGRGRPGGDAPALLIRQGEKILIPEGSALRSRLTVVAASAAPVSDTLVLPGVVEANPQRTASIQSPLSGRLLTLKVGLGDRVSKGQLLAVIDAPDLAQAYADDDKARDALELADKNLKRQVAQHQLGVASDRDLDQANSDQSQAAAEHARAQARLRALGVAAQRGESPRLLQLFAPMAGSVTALSAAPGNLINDPTQALMSIADLSSVWVTALVPEKDIGAVVKNQDASVVLLAYPDRTLHGKVLFVSDVVEPDLRRSKLRIAFENSDYSLKPNMFATVTLSGAAHSEVLLPSSALLMNNDRTSVFIAISPWVFERRRVEPALSDGGAVAIRSGIAPGEAVVVKGAILLND